MFDFITPLWHNTYIVFDQKYCALRFACACTLFDRSYRADRTCLARILGITSGRLYIILSYEVCVQKSAGCVSCPRFKQCCVSCPVVQHTNPGHCLAGTAKKFKDTYRVCKPRIFKFSLKIAFFEPFCIMVWNRVSTFLLYMHTHKIVNFIHVQIQCVPQDSYEMYVFV
jgi:hypothetical protein